jgi:O-antigen/teichoic acid export membrane protein
MSEGSSQPFSEELEPEGSGLGRSPLKQRIVRSLLWLGVGYGVSDIPKLGAGFLLGQFFGGQLFTNPKQIAIWAPIAFLIVLTVLNPSFLLTRLANPEAFGLMAIANIAVSGTELLLAISIGFCVIQSDREDEAFLNTAWLTQIGLSGLISLGCCLLAYPASLLYKEPTLFPLLLLTALSPLISGLASTKIATAERQLTIGRLTLMNVAVSLLGGWITVGLTYLLQSVWGLAIGAIASSLIRTALSHLFLQGKRNQFQWEMAAFWEVWRFTRWILGVAVLGFLGAPISIVIAQKFLSVSDLGLRAVTLPFATAGLLVASRLGRSILLPVYAEVRRDQPSSFYGALRTGRLSVIGLVWAIALLLSFFGKTAIDLFYGDGYAKAGSMLQILAVGTLVKIIANSYDEALYARGETGVLFGFTAIATLLELSGIAIGGQLAGVRGLLIGSILGYWLIYLIKAAYFARRSLWQREIDLPFLGVATLVAAIVFAIS